MPLRDALRKVLFSSVLIAVGPVLSLVLLEVGAHAIERGLLSPPGQTLSEPLLRPNPNGTGSFRSIPNLRLSVVIKGQAVDLSTNSFGMRWREVQLAKPQGVKRLAVLGDSFAYGSWASTPALTFPGVLERRLGNRYEVLNFGVSGYGLDDMELMLREEVLRFEPDYILVASYNGNDFRDTWLGIDKFVVREGFADFDPEVLARIPECCNASNHAVAEPAPDHSYLRARVSAFASGRLLTQLLGLDNRWVRFRVRKGFTTETFWSQYPWPDVALEARDRSLEALERMRATAVAAGSRLAVVYIPFSSQVYALKKSGPDWDVSFPQIYIKQWARERDVPVLDLLPLLREHVVATNERLYLSGDTHFDKPRPRSCWRSAEALVHEGGTVARAA